MPNWPLPSKMAGFLPLEIGMELGKMPPKPPEMIAGEFGGVPDSVN